MKFNISKKLQDNIDLMDKSTVIRYFNLINSMTGAP